MKTIRSRFSLWIFALILFILGSVFFFIRDIQMDSLEQIEISTTQLSDEFLTESWQHNMRSLSSIFAEQLVRPLYLKDLQSIQDLAMVVASRDFVNSVIVLSESGMILSDGTPEAAMLGTMYDPALWPVSTETFFVHTDIAFGPTHLGTIIVGFDATQAQKLAEDMRERTQAQFRRMETETQFRLAILVALTLTLGLGASYMLSRGLVSPLEQISEAIKRIGRRDYDISLPFRRQDELGRLGRTLEEVAEVLKTTTVSKRYLENVLGNMPVGVAITDLAGNITSTNRQFLEFFPSREQHGTLHDALDMTLEQFATMTEPLKQGEPVNDLDIVLRNTTGVRDALISGVRIDNGASREDAQYLFIVHDITERKGLERKLRHIASHDTLTGLPNRRHIFHEVEKQVMRFRQNPSEVFWLLFVDLDRFKQINDTHGHHMGDEVLKAVAGRIVHVSRENDVVARLSGDEFLVLIKPHLTAELAMGVAQRVLESIRQPIAAGGETLNISASLGLTCCTDLDCSAESLIVVADAAMYEAKTQGKGRIAVAKNNEKRRPLGPPPTTEQDSSG